jgi:hypothetical protein
MKTLTDNLRKMYDSERTLALEVYKDHGYESRSDYIQGLIDEYGSEPVIACVTCFGPDEDFDGTVIELEDWDIINGQFGVGA